MKPLFDTRILRALGIAVTICGMLIIFNSFAKQFFRWDEVAYGCDAYGYMRQSQLFRENGIIGGLDTAYRNDATDEIVETAQTAQVPTNIWRQAVAPHCHHYAEATQKIILQYPPLTGAMLAIFQEQHQVRFLLGYSALFLGLLVAFSLSPSIGPIGIGFSLLLYWTLLTVLERDGSASYSVIPSVLFACTLSLVIARFATTDLSKNPNRFVLFLLGLCIGLAVVARIPNFLLITGVLPFVYWRIFHFTPRSPWHAKLGLLVLCTGILVGILPLLAFNEINVGSPFATTYDSNDADRSGLNLERITSALIHYFGGSAGYLNLAALASVATLAILYRKDRSRLLTIFLIPAPLLLSSIVFFATHPIRTSYYLTPSSIFVVFFCFSFWMLSSSKSSQNHMLKFAPAFSAASFLALSLALLFQLPLANHLDRFRETSNYGFSKAAFLWGDIWGSAASYYGGVPTAKMVFLWENDLLKNIWVETLMENGYSQYFLADTDNSKKVIKHISKSYCLLEVPAYLSQRMYVVASRLEDNDQQKCMVIF